MNTEKIIVKYHLYKSEKKFFKFSYFKIFYFLVDFSFLSLTFFWVFLRA